MRIMSGSTLETELETPFQRSMRSLCTICIVEVHSERIDPRNGVFHSVSRADPGNGMLRRHDIPRTDNHGANDNPADTCVKVI